MKKKILETIFNAIDDVNRLLPEEQKLSKNSSEIIYGKKGKIDSLGLINLIAATEEKISENFGVMTNLTNEKTMIKDESPFRTIGTIYSYISIILGGESNG